MTDNLQPTNASLSTMWAINNYADLNEFFETARSLGLEEIELNHQVDSKLLSTVNWNHYQLSSIHEPCPADISTKDLIKRDWVISSTNEECRKLGVETVKNSIRLAAEKGAPIVVIHCGNVTPDMSLESKLRGLYMKGESQSPEYHQVKAEITRSRSSEVGPRLKAVKTSLDELIDYATSLNIRLGLENRYHYMDIPIMDEMGELLDLANSSQLGFIYDVGHAQALDQLGFFAHEEWLIRYSYRMIGCHLHDVRGLTDHLAPGLGDIDFKRFANYLPEDAFRTLELQPGNTLTQLRHGIGHLIDAGCIGYL